MIKMPFKYFQDDVHLEVEGKWELTVKLKEKIMDDEATARFTTKSHTLTVYMPVCNS